MECKATIGEVINVLTKLVHNKSFSPAAVIRWVEICEDDDTYIGDTIHVPKGSIIFQVEEIVDGEVCSGTLTVAPARVSKLLN